VGSCLAGPRDLLREGWTIRKRLGGGMRQSGILTAACLYALDHTLPRLADDHAAAKILAERLAGHPAVTVRPPSTNIVMLDLKAHRADDAVRLLAEAGVLVVSFGPTRLRAVTHLDVTPEMVAQAADTIARVLG
jgi:threonine aldolase